MISLSYLGEGDKRKEVLKSNLSTAIFHKESVVCTLKCHRSSLFIGHFHFCPVFEGATVFRQRRVDSYCLGQVSKTPAGKSTPEGCTIHKTGVKLKYLPNTSEPEVHNSFKRSRASTPKSQQSTLLSENPRRLNVNAWL